MYLLTITRETYSRTESGLSWCTKPDETETETLPWHRIDPDPSDPTGVAWITRDRWGEDVHRKITEPDTLRWFRRLGGSEYAERCYTPVGYIVTRLVSTNPDRTVRVVRKFKITRDDLDQERRARERAAFASLLEAEGDEVS